MDRYTRFSGKSVEANIKKRIPDFVSIVLPKRKEEELSLFIDPYLCMAPAGFFLCNKKEEKKEEMSGFVGRLKLESKLPLW